MSETRSRNAKDKCRSDGHCNAARYLQTKYLIGKPTTLMFASRTRTRASLNINGLIT